MRNRNIGILTIGLSALLIGSPVAAGTITGRQLPYASYLHLENDGPRCAATSIINSFGFLISTYADVYDGTNLLPGAGTDAASARMALDEGWNTPGSGIHG
jgi:hypothetical protein